MTRDSSSDSLTKLHRLLVDHFDLDELRTLCFDLKVDFDTLRGDEKSAKARELITVMLHQNRLAELAGKLQGLRPKVAWLNVETLSPEERLAWTTATEVSSAADYLVALRDYCANLPYLTLHDIRPPKTLDEVYVPLKVRPQPQKEKQDLRGLGDLEGLERHELLSISDVMRRHDPPHVLILGEPGAGKSTLLRQLAEQAWDAPGKIGLDGPHLPILVPLRRLAVAEGALEERLNCALTTELTMTQALPQGFFTNWPKQTGEKWLILLDALDEVPAEQRAQLMQWLRGLLGRIGQSRIVLTSRPSGYAHGELDDKLFSHYDLLSFTPDQTGEFAHKWFGDKAKPFLKELDRVRAGALSGTPLLLTIAAKVYLEKGTLPERRSGLYGQFVDIWLREAIEHRDLKTELGDVVCDVAKFALSHLALTMTEQPARTEASLSKVAANYLRDTVPLSPDRAEIAGERFLKVMARRSGMFTCRGDVYDFIHPTFREYLAARAVVQESKRNSAYDLKYVWRRAVSRWADNNWREVALFALSTLSDEGQDVTPLVKHIWGHGLLEFLLGSDKEERLYFAGATLAEQVKVDAGLSDDIISELFIRAQLRPWLLVPKDQFAAVDILGNLHSYPSVDNGLLALSNDEKVDKQIRERAAEAMGKRGRVDEAVPILRMLMRDTMACDQVNIDAIKAMGYLGQVDDVLLLARDSKVSKWIRERAVEALGELGLADKLQILAYDEKADEGIRKSAVMALGKLGRADYLLTLVRDAKNIYYISETAVAELYRLQRADDLLALLRDEKVDTLVGYRIVETLGDLAASLLPAVACDEKVNEMVRMKAAETLGEMWEVERRTGQVANEVMYVRFRRYGKETVQAWLALARDERVDWSVRVRAAEELREFADARILPTLEQIAQADNSKSVRLAAQRIIDQIRQRTEHTHDDAQTTPQA
jgi:HEAT repeat protein/energy-coupling factor transporter ATP-binding protein EcfA2